MAAKRRPRGGQEPALRPYSRRCNQPECEPENMRLPSTSETHNANMETENQRSPIRPVLRWGTLPDTKPAVPRLVVMVRPSLACPPPSLPRKQGSAPQNMPRQVSSAAPASGRLGLSGRRCSQTGAALAGRCKNASQRAQLTRSELCSSEPQHDFRCPRRRQSQCRAFWGVAFFPVALPDSASGQLCAGKHGQHQPCRCLGPRGPSPGLRAFWQDPVLQTASHKCYPPASRPLPPAPSPDPLR